MDLHEHYIGIAVHGSHSHIEPLFPGSVLSWITTAILLFGLGDIYFDEGSWKNLDKRIWLIVIVVTIFTINSLLCLILQSGLIRHIRKNNQTAILETVNQLGKSVQ